MKKQLLALGLCGFSYTTAFCQSEPTEHRVMLAGDSWAVFMNADGTFNNTLRKWGHSDKTCYSNLIISENGSETNDFIGGVKQDEIAAQLLANPSIEVVHLSIGGNDVLGDWDVTFTQEQTDSLEAQVTVRLTTILDFIKSVRPGIRIVWSGYTYPNFGEVIGSLPSGAQSGHPFYGTWSGMGFPTFTQLNDILNSFSATVEAYTDSDPQVDFVNCTGILQHVFGQNTPLAVAPGGTYAPFEAPLPAGFPQYPSPANTMRDYFIFKDCFHLSAPAYSAFLDYQFQKFYHKFLMDDQYLLSSSDASTGSVSSTGVISSEPMLGESSGVDYATVLSFNTPAMVGTELVKASLFMRRQSLVGGNPYSGGLQVKVVNGNFGTTFEVDAEDLTDPGDASGQPGIFGSNGGNGHWVRLELPTALLPYINNSAATQFVISAPDASGALVTFHDASDPDFAPVLNLDYVIDPSSVSDEDGRKPAIRVFPNPTTDLLYIVANGETMRSLEMVNMLGAVVLSKNGSHQSVDVSMLPAGQYLLHVTTETGSAWQRVVKQ
jgi:hypothetical protein